MGLKILWKCKFQYNNIPIYAKFAQEYTQESIVRLILFRPLSRYKLPTDN